MRKSKTQGCLYCTRKIRIPAQTGVQDSGISTVWDGNLYNVRLNHHLDGESFKDKDHFWHFLFNPNSMQVSAAEIETKNQSSPKFLSVFIL